MALQLERLMSSCVSVACLSIMKTLIQMYTQAYSTAAMFTLTKTVTQAPSAERLKSFPAALGLGGLGRV